MSESESQNDFDHYTAAASEVQKNLLVKDKEIQQLRNQLDYNTSDRHRSRFDKKIFYFLFLNVFFIGVVI